MPTGTIDRKEVRIQSSILMLLVSVYASKCTLLVLALVFDVGVHKLGLGHPIMPPIG